MPSTGQRTPPYTPLARGKRRPERSDSPAPSIHPAETTSPPKKAAKHDTVVNDVKVEELAESEAGYWADEEVVYPDELEEVNSSDGDDEMSSSDDDDDAHSDTTGIARRLSRLRCGDEDAEENFERERHRRHLTRRMSARLFKRTHSQSVKGDTEDTDADAIDDQDLESSQRRLRRRVRGPREAETDVMVEETMSSPLESSRQRSDMEGLQSPETPEQYRRHRKQPVESDGMEIDS